jgi:dTDP-4-dehydrorhamnose reductase
VLLEEWSADEIIGIGSREVDVRDRSQLHTYFASCRPEYTVLAAAYTDVDGCERDQKRAHDVNCIGAVNVAFECREVGSRLLFVSTDYVFGGEKSIPYEVDDQVHPANVYGETKAQGEKLVRETLPQACILRTSWVFGANGRSFPNTILEAAQGRENLSVVADQIGRPTYNRDLARVIVTLCKAGAQGTVHVSNSGSCSWYELACAILRAAGLTDVTVEAISTEALPRPARRPQYSVLSLDSLKAYGIRMRPWQDTLADYIGERKALMSSYHVFQPAIGRRA